ncbi:Ethylene-responsive transcription factor CRF1 [Hordeum vulgare]|nr:Ethylene-responsive transcription factor CRF1 [Hordeum vulgare]
MCLGLGTFNTVERPRCMWCLNRPRRDVIFPKVMTRELAQQLAPPPRIVTEEDRRQNRRWERHVGIAEMDEHVMIEWRQQFPQDVLDERAFFA